MTNCLLLAAGSSSRMAGLTLGTGRGATPKMLLPFKGKTLLQHVIDEIKNSEADHLTVVTGCYHSALNEILQAQETDLIENKRWEEGMGTSINCGVGHILQRYPHTENIIVLVCDQPYISSALLNGLMISKQKTGKGIIASAYNNTHGTPVLFDKKYFDKLLLLNGQTGAKKIVQQHINDTAEVAFPGGAFDIDTPEDYYSLQ
jgi:molybdenum cofactor cytidylyltransferase